MENYRVKELKKRAASHIDRLTGTITGINDKLAENPEQGFNEYKAVEWLTEILSDQGFEVKKKIAGLETAFRAEFDTGKEGPVIGLLCEYDALPEIGHGCGHNMIASASLGAGLALKTMEDLKGKIIVFGCPGEEVGGGKVAMVEKGYFDDIDAAMLVHPSNRNRVYTTSLAIDAFQFTYKGQSAHAATAPEKGINALDGVIQLFNGINALREHLRDDVRIHGVINEGGKTPNLVPERAVARFYIRAGERSYLDEVVKKVKKIASGAEMMTGAEVEWEKYELSNDNLTPSKRLADIFEENLKLLGIEVDDSDLAAYAPGSTDMGNVSQVVPAVQAYIAIGSEELVGHTREFARTTMSATGHSALIKAAKALAFTSLDLMMNEIFLEEIKVEFDNRI